MHWKWIRPTSLKMKWRKVLQASPKLFWHHISKLSQKNLKPYGRGLTHLRLNLHTWVLLNQWKLLRSQSLALEKADLSCAQRMLTSDWQSDFYLFLHNFYKQLHRLFSETILFTTVLQKRNRGSESDIHFADFKKLAYLPYSQARHLSQVYKFSDAQAIWASWFSPIPSESGDSEMTRLLKKAIGEQSCMFWRDIKFFYV